LTANAFAEDRARCFGAGMSDFIAEPFDNDVLFSTLRTGLDRYTALEQSRPKGQGV
jgi:CheY-like chemotaxis protein